MSFSTSLCILGMLILSAVTINAYYENQPKILTNKGSLILEAARDRNITLRLSRDSALFVNDINVVEVMQKFQNATAAKQEVVQQLPTVAVVQGEIKSLKRNLELMAARLSNLQNSTRLAPQSQSSRRFSARLGRLLTRLTLLEDTLLNDECAGSGLQPTNPCKNGGVCFDGYKDFHCECTESWTGKTCENDVDECYLYAGTDLGCQNNANCTNTPGSYNCVCRKGFSGTHCRLRNAICETAQPAELCGHGVCVHAINDIGYTCICDQGWTKDNGSTHACTIDVNECDEATNPCHSECINSPGSFKCGACPRGYSGNGVTCIDIDECASNNGGCSVRPKVACINSEGSYHCGNCPLGWTGDGHNCELASSNSCDVENICHVLAKCEYISETVVCTCPHGMFGHGFGPGGCTAVATNNPCENHECKNNGTCIESGRGTSCICALGYTGALCDQNNACNPNPCLNGGTCTLLLNNKFRCSCLRGTTGSTCNILRSTCGSILRQETGELSYPPDNASSYESNERCAWIIRTANTKIIDVTFSRFDLESATDCSKDWLQIHDGRSLAAQLLGRFCGNALPLGGNFVSSHQQLFFWFRSDNTTNGAGFKMSWTSKPHTCGDILNLREVDSGVIRSPGYPGKTATNRDCEWQIEAPYGYRLVLRFYEVNLGGDQNCTRDTVKIYDSDLLFKSICETDSTSIPEPLHTSSNKATLHFHTDNIRADSSFQMHYEVIPAVPHCGGIFTEASGIISGYITAKVCLYLIQQPAGTQIKLEFTKLDLLSYTDCILQKIEIFDGKTDEDPLIKRVCGHDIPEVLTSNGNFMLLRYEYVLSEFELSKSFEAKYSRICDDRFFGPDSGIISTPNYPNAYYDHMTCTFNIYGPANTVVQLNFTDFSMTPNLPNLLSDDDDVMSNKSALADDYSNFVDLYLSNNNKRRYYKGDPMLILSEKNRAQIVFHSAVNSLNARGMRVEYTFINISCGGVLTEDNGTIEHLYETSGCEWIIEAPAGKHILLDLSFTSVGITCTPEVEALLIYSNSSESGQLLGSYCRSVMLKREPYHTNILTIILKEMPRRDRIYMYGLVANYSFANSDEECGGHFTARSGIIKTPGWPKLYDASTNCTWVISAPLGHKIELVVRNFSIETTSQNYCRDDSLEIRNGKSKESPLIGKYCGTRIPARIPSFTNSLYLNFISDDFISDYGFYMTWEQTATGCGGKLTSNKGSIHSPHNTDISAGAVSCDWQIIVAQGSKININLTNIGTPDLCSDQILTIYDGPTSASRVLKLNCNNDTTILKATSNQVLIRYSLEENTRDGLQFLLDYDTNCNILIDGLQGVVESPNFPEEYPAEMNCAWDIHGGRNNKISLVFSHLQLEKRNTNCNYDYLEVIDMRNDLVLSKQKYCDSPPNVFTSEGNHILLKFVSDYSENGLGFRAEYKRIGCGEHLQGEFTSIESPNAPYSVDMDCDWYIEVPVGKQIVLNIGEIHIETENVDCSVDAFTVTEVKNSTTYLLRECQLEKMPITITSPANRLYIHFVTSNTRSRKYFKATTNTIQATCGGIYRGSSGQITSPNFADGFATNVKCIWSITVENTYGIRLYFDEFNITDTPSCVDNFLELKKLDGNDEHFLERACGEKKPLIHFVDGNHISVTLKVGLTGWSKFSMLYQKMCGAELMEPSGFLKSSSNERCAWKIEAPEVSHISLDILHLECLCLRSEEVNCTSSLMVYSSPGLNNTHFFCDSTKANFIFPTNILYISARNVNFRAKYSTIQNSCGGTLTSLRGILASPYYPSSYPANVECVWEIEATSGNFIELNFLDLDIVKSEYCNDDFLEIRTAERGDILGLFCTSDVQPETLVGFEKVWIKFRSSESTSTANGFKLSWNYAHINEINGTRGTIESPPLHSLRNHEPYNWRIVVSRGQLISLNFQEYNKGLNLYDGFDEVALKIDINYSPWQFISSTNVIYLTSSNADLDKFKIVWTAISSEAVKANATASKCHNELLLLATDSVNVSSSGYPHGYDGNQQCDWIIKTADPTEHVVFNLYEAKLEDFPECRVDYLRALSSSNMEDWHEELKICQSSDMSFRPIRSVHGTPYVKLEFNTDATVNGSGFTGLAKSACGSNMTGPVGFILDNQFQYSDSECLWHIKVRPGKRIAFNFDFSDNVLKSNEQCVQYAIIYDGLDSGASMLPPGQICNRPDRNFKTAISTSNQVMLKYNLTLPFGTLHRNLWNLTYREFADCGGEVRLTHFAKSVNISSPRYPNVPQPYTECDWIVIGPAGESLQANFVDRFDMNTRYCDKEFVALYDGSSTLARKLGQYCTKPNDIRTTGNVLFLRYSTNIAEPRMGFRVNVSIGICGGTYTDLSGQISSNNYPALGAYPKHSICEYKIKLPEHFRIRLNFSDLHLPFDAHNLNGSDRIEIVSLDYSIVYYGNTTQMPLLDFETNEILIRFRSFQGGNKFRGFSLKYSRMYKNCYRDVSEESGFLILNNQNPTVFITCRWKITVPKGQRVRLEFMNWDSTTVNNSTARLIPIPRVSYRNTMKQITIYNDHDMQSKITEIDLDTYNASQIIQSSDNFMSVRLFIKYPRLTNIFIKARYSSDDDSLCPPDISDSSTGLINLNALVNINNNHTFYCRLQFTLNGQQTLMFKIKELVITSISSTIIPYAVRFKNEELYEPFKILRSNVSNSFVSLSPKRGSVSIQQTDLTRISQFSVTYRRHECGGMHQLADSFTLNYPDIQDLNYGELECVWTLRASFDDASFNLTGDVSLTDSCEREYIAIYAGVSTLGAELARICRDSPKFNSTVLRKRYTTIVYHVEDYQKLKRSTFSLTAVKTIVCGTKIFVNSEAQSIALTGKAYKNNMECSWEFETNIGLYLSLAFIGRFFVEDSINCTKDHLEVQRYENGLWIPEARYCGREVPSFLNITSHRMQIVFRTNENITGDGFGFQVSINCIISFNVTSGSTHIIPSPSTKGLRTRSIHCVYTFISDSDSLINVRIRDRDSLQSSYLSSWKLTCDIATITAYKTNNSDATAADKFCVSGEVRSRNYLRLDYKALIEKKFDIEYGLNTCGGNISTPALLRPPQHEELDRYADNMKCNWYIVAPPDHSVVVDFKYFDMEYTVNCIFDYVAIYAGPTISDEKRLTQLCGNLTEPAPFVMVDNNQAVISAASDYSMSGKGFLARVLFTRNCNERITLTDGNSPLTLVRAFNVSASEVLVCSYMITAPIGYRVAVELRELQLNSATTSQYCGNCSNCYNIEVLDSLTAKRTSMGKYCTNGRLDVKLLTSHEDMVLRLKALVTGQYNFEIVLQMEQSACGENRDLTLQPDGHLVINFPASGNALYPPNIHCTWRIQSTEEFKIEFTSLLLQNVSQVTGKCIDYVHITGHYLSQYFCGNSTGFHYFPSKVNDANVEITFHSDATYEDKGFSLTAVHRTNCNRTYTKLSDIMLYSNWDDTSFSCVDEIRVPDNYTISLFVPSIMLRNENCSRLHFKVVDLNSNMTLLNRCNDSYSETKLFTTTNALRINVASFSYITLLYVASSKALPPGCGGQLYTKSGQFSSPPYNDRNHSLCRWDIMVPAPLKIDMYFFMFDMGTASNCQTDYVNILEVQPNGNEKIINKFCGQDVPEHFVTPGSHIAIISTKSPNFDGTGWTLSFSTYEDPMEWRKNLITNIFS